MDALGRLQDGSDASAKLSPLVGEYRRWIDDQATNVPGSPAKRRETGEELLQRARLAAERIERGIALLGDPTCLDAFRLANQVMAEAAKRRLGAIAGKPPESIQPAWRPFQLAFILMNLVGIAEPGNPEREVVDLLFFPTGGKTEAYLGLAAFTLLLRRLRNPGIQSAGVSVLMRNESVFSWIVLEPETRPACWQPGSPTGDHVQFRCVRIGMPKEHRRILAGACWSTRRSRWTSDSASEHHGMAPQFALVYRRASGAGSRSVKGNRRNLRRSQRTSRGWP